MSVLVFSISDMFRSMSHMVLQRGPSDGPKPMERQFLWGVGRVNKYFLLTLLPKTILKRIMDDYFAENKR
jgi:hypothetical protein